MAQIPHAPKERKGPNKDSTYVLSMAQSPNALKEGKGPNKD